MKLFVHSAISSVATQSSSSLLKPGLNAAKSVSIALDSALARGGPITKYCSEPQ